MMNRPIFDGVCIFLGVLSFAFLVSLMADGTSIAKTSVYDVTYGCGLFHCKNLIIKNCDEFESTRNAGRAMSVLALLLVIVGIVMHILDLVKVSIAGKVAMFVHIAAVLFSLLTAILCTVLYAADYCGGSMSEFDPNFGIFFAYLVFVFECICAVMSFFLMRNPVNLQQEMQA